MKYTLITISIFLATFTGKVSFAGESTLSAEHGNWQSRVVYDNKQVRFRAVTTYTENSDYVVLTMDRLPNECNTQYLNMNIVGSSVASKSYTTESLFGNIRVDENPIHNMSYTINFEKGERIFYAAVTNFDGEDTLLTELRTGNNLRFKLKAGKVEYFLRFSLLGFPAAADRTLQLCNAFNNGKSDEDYFNKDSKKSETPSDKSYF